MGSNDHPHPQDCLPPQPSFPRLPSASIFIPRTTFFLSHHPYSSFPPTSDPCDSSQQFHLSCSHQDLIQVKADL